MKARFRTHFNPGMGKPPTDEYGFYRQFYCFLCRGWMRWYAIVALVLLTGVALATLGYIWREAFLRG